MNRLTPDRRGARVDQRSREINLPELVSLPDGYQVWDTAKAGREKFGQLTASVLTMVGLPADSKPTATRVAWEEPFNPENKPERNIVDIIWEVNTYRVGPLVVVMSNAENSARAAMDSRKGDRCILSMQVAACLEAIENSKQEDPSQPVSIVSVVDFRGARGVDMGVDMSTVIASVKTLFPIPELGMHIVLVDNAFASTVVGIVLNPVLANLNVNAHLKIVKSEQEVFDTLQGRN